MKTIGVCVRGSNRWGGLRFDRGWPVIEETLTYHRPEPLPLLVHDSFHEWLEDWWEPSCVTQSPFLNRPARTTVGMYTRKFTEDKPHREWLRKFALGRKKRPGLLFVPIKSGLPQWHTPDEPLNTWQPEGEVLGLFLRWLDEPHEADATTGGVLADRLTDAAGPEPFIQYLRDRWSGLDGKKPAV